MINLKLPDGEYVATAGANATEFSVGLVCFIAYSEDVYVKGICIDDTVYVRNGVVTSAVLGVLTVIQLDKSAYQ